MDIDWLEDFLAVAEKGHFAQAAKQRNITQSALSRRIKAVEYWAGTELLDRGSHPIVPTKAGVEFISATKEIVARLSEIRGAMSALSRQGDSGITIASLHTLALYTMPELTEILRKSQPNLSVNIVAETRTLGEYLSALSEGVSDLFICYDHPAVSPELNLHEYDRTNLMTHRFALYAATSSADQFVEVEALREIPYVAFSGSSFMSRIVEHCMRGLPFARKFDLVYRASLAESLLAACQRGLGVAWLPDAAFPSGPEDAGVSMIFPEVAQTLEVCAYRSRHAPSRPIVDRVWEALCALQNQNGAASLTGTRL